MKQGQLIGIAIAGVCGLGAFLLAKNMVTPPREIKVETNLNSTEVLVARANIGLGQVTTESSFRWQAWPADAVPQGSVTRQGGAGGSMRTFVGSIARTPILAGEPITKTKLVNAKEGGVLAAILPEGKRAVSVSIRDEHLAAGKLILPNDRVDVILIRKMRGRNGQDDISSETVFRDVRVLAIGQRIEIKEGQKQADGNTATLELTADEAEEMVLARAKGEITLSLRSIADFNKKEDGAGGKKEVKASSQVKLLRYGVKSRAQNVN
ncbi:MAG: Flp pilus assembly protein CpaB [Hyphomicrobiaceae bacterium]|nr:Flp pilus assembly protein CpaB [Hyphomicrobiaceae bacterium]